MRGFLYSSGLRDHLALALVLALLAFGGPIACNTLEGAGDDIENAGDEVEGWFD